MPNSKVQVTVRSADPVADVMLLDSLFNAVSRGVGEIQVDVEPGMYLARAVAGNRVEEKPVALRSGAPEQVVDLPLVWFDSPIPLDHTRTTHEYHQGPVSQALRASLASPTETIGGFLLCVRDAAKPQLSGSPEEQSAYREAYKGFRLLDLEAAAVVDFESLPSALRLADGLLLHEAKLPPANYQLEWQAAQGPAMRIPVIVRPMMTTQLYALVQSNGAGSGGWQPDLANAAVAFAWSHHGFVPDSPEMRLAERARYCLSRGANMMNAPQLDEMLLAKFENPMLGVLGAHLLLLEKEPRYDLIDLVLTNTGGLLGDDFPDVVALKMKFASMTRGDGVRRVSDIVPVNFPPLLRRSWDYLLEASTSTPDLIPAGSFSARISRSIVNSGIWLAWRPEQAPTEGVKPGGPIEIEKKLARMRAPSAPAKSFGLATAIGAWAGKAWEYLRRSEPSTSEEATTLRASRDRLKQVLDKVLDGNDVRELAAASDQERDPIERARDLVEFLVRNVEWDKVISQLRRRGAADQLATSLSDIEKALLPALQFAKQHLEDGGELDRRFVEGMAKSLAVPMPVLLDSLAALTRQLVRIALGKPKSPDHA